MLNQTIAKQNLQHDARLAHIIEQVSIPERGALTLEGLQILEKRLLQRRLLPQPLGALANNPIWFIAETERNIFLWRNGLSLADQFRFEFWVDYQALIELRLQRLENVDSENPFLAPLWGQSLPEGTTAEHSITQQEVNYLKTFLHAMQKIESHARALCETSSILAADLGQTERPARILIPWPPVIKERFSPAT